MAKQGCCETCRHWTRDVEVRSIGPCDVDWPKVRAIAHRSAYCDRYKVRQEVREVTC